MTPPPEKTPVPVLSPSRFSTEDVALLRQLLFEKKLSRNQHFDQFEQLRWRRLHRVAQHLRALHRELQRTDGHTWVEQVSEGQVCLHIHRPTVGLSRRTFLSEIEWLLLQELLAQTTPS